GTAACWGSMGSNTNAATFSADVTTRKAPIAVPVRPLASSTSTSYSPRGAVAGTTAVTVCASTSTTSPRATSAGPSSVTWNASLSWLDLGWRKSVTISGKNEPVMVKTVAAPDAPRDGATSITSNTEP